MPAQAIESDKKLSFAFLKYVESAYNNAETLQRASFLTQLPSQIRDIFANRMFLAIGADCYVRLSITFFHFAINDLSQE